MAPHINRRKFLKNAGIAGSSLVIGMYFVSCKTEEPEPEGIIELYKLNIDNVPTGIDIGPNIIIDPSGAITIMSHRPDMGQGTHQSIPLLIAEELEVDFDQITIKQAPGDAKRYGRQGVGGSATIRTMWEPMRKMGAAAKEMLIKAAADQWGVEPSTCYAASGKVFNANKESKSYGELAEAASQLEVPQEPKLKDPKEFKLIGKSVPRPSVNLKVSGQANFGIDMKKEGMVIASIERSPSYSATVESYDEAAAMAIPGVLKVMKTTRLLGKWEWEGIAVVADNYWSALKGRKALNAKWKEAEKLHNTESMYTEMREKAKTDGIVVHEEGSFDKTFTKASQQLSAEYETPFLAHAAMEPESALADVQEDQVEVWAPTQFPNWAKGEIAKLMGWEEDETKLDNITVNVSFMGGGFGRKALYDFVLESVALSKELKKPVKVIWNREDDITQSPFRPGAVNTLRGGLDENGKLVALEHKVTTPAIAYNLFGQNDGKTPPGGVMEPVGEPFYNLPSFISKYVFVDFDPIPICWWRSVYSSTNVFAHECFIDELAEAAQKDPLAFRLEMMDHQPRRQKMMETLREKSGWDNLTGDNIGRGVAVTHCFSTTAGHVVKVSKDSNGKVKIDKITAIIDCGIAVNPDFVKAQTEGNIVFGLTAALKDAITFENGKPVQTNFHNYRMLRIDEMPEIEVIIMDNLEDPTGVGEPALPPIAPALVNAIFDLTGKRIRKLPFDLGSIS